MNSNEGQLVIRDHDATWPIRFSELAIRAKAHLGALVAQVEHVGSTAVPGLIAKPVIEMDAVLASSSNLSNAELRRHLAFRDALRADRALRDAYSELKKSAARQYSHDRKAYTEAKSEFIRTIVGAA